MANSKRHLAHHAGTARALRGAVAALALTGLLAGPGPAQRAEPLPDDLEGVDIIEKLGATIPLDVPFVDSSGKKVKLGDYFGGDRPVLLTMNYSSCPMLCSLHLNGLVDALTELEWTAGGEFRMVTISIDPTESTTLARKTKQRYLQDYGRPGAGGGWEFLTGTKDAIDTIANAIGFQYRYLPDEDQYAHAAATFIVTPEGVLSRNLYGVVYDPQTIRLSLVEASEHRIGSALDKILLYCFHYDETKGKYGPAAFNLMRAGGVLTLIVFGITLTSYWRRDVRRKRELEARHPHAIKDGLRT